RPVLAADNDPAAVAVARTNARINGAARWVRPLVSEGYGHRLLKAAGPFDLIVANILAEPLAAMAAELRAHLAPNGRAVLSGLLIGQERLVLNPHRAQGLRLLRRLRLGEWSTLILRR
ncbi:MAG: 50S ribosomal protein L11 methyltransferase, partial [Kiloniellales bacterium]|nr:50S ribosomal protein L11 methyltransferase [Kiloniellales bacterium]